MSAVKQLRKQVGLTQQQLAARAETAQSTIAAYEAGRKSPTLRTLEKTARAVGLEAHVVFVTRMTRSDKRSLAYHRAVLQVIRMDPATVISRARTQLTFLSDLHPHASGLLRRWHSWLDLSIEDLANRLLDVHEDARDMRQISPFAGVLSASERARVLREFQRSDALE
ncbi:MAG: helix-turn-helix transcriptional regulator [Proteobacteria bacterium]|nr:helix-turn-helix transcriptional regulator [Pseudomonadota bacterium]